MKKDIFDRIELFFFCKYLFAPLMKNRRPRVFSSKSYGNGTKINFDKDGNASGDIKTDSGLNDVSDVAKVGNIIEPDMLMDKTMYIASNDTVSTFPLIKSKKLSETSAMEDVDSAVTIFPIISSKKDSKEEPIIEEIKNLALLIEKQEEMDESENRITLQIDNIKNLFSIIEEKNEEYLNHSNSLKEEKASPNKPISESQKDELSGTNEHSEKNSVINAPFIASKSEIGILAMNKDEKNSENKKEDNIDNSKKSIKDLSEKTLSRINQIIKVLKSISKYYRDSKEFESISTINLDNGEVKVNNMDYFFKNLLMMRFLKTLFMILQIPLNRTYYFLLMILNIQ